MEDHDRTKKQPVSLRLPIDIYEWINAKALADDRTHTYGNSKTIKKDKDDEKNLTKPNIK